MFDLNKGVKLKELSIDNYKILKHFKISFCDKDDKPLPMVILAGINGSGKTAILESIFGIKKINGLKLKVLQNNVEKYFDSDSSGLSIDKEGVKSFWYNDEIKNHILFFSYFIDLTNIKNFLPEYIQKLVFEYDVKASEVYQKIKENINQIFQDLNLYIEFDSRDAKGNIYFRNKLSNENFLIDDLSSGEKTLISELLFLYLSDIENQVILIDEPELSLHPAWQNRVLKLYESFAIKNNCQIIIATHSPQIIGSAKPEYLRILTFQDNSVKVLDNFNKSYGLEFNKVLLNIMGVKELRVPEVEEKFTKLKRYIQEKNSERFVELFAELEEILGSDDTDLQLLKLQANLKGLNVPSN